MSLIEELTSYESEQTAEPVQEESTVQATAPEPKPVSATASLAPSQKEREKTDDIPYGRFREVLEDRNELKAKLQEIENKLRSYEERQAKPAQLPVEEAPNQDDDPVAYAIWQGKQAEKARDEIRQYKQHQEEESARTQAIQGITQHYRSSATEYMKTTPDFMDAYAHAMNVRTQQLMIMGATQEQAQSAVMQEEIQLAANAIQRRQNPAEMVYNLAKLWGYTPKSVSAAEAPVTEKMKQVKAGKNAEGLGSSSAADKSEEEEDIPRGSFKEFEQAFKERGFKRRS